MILCTMPQCQTTAGCICGLATAKIGDAIPMIGAEYVCEVPRDLGKVTKIKIKGERVTVETDSGIQMIVPVKRTDT